MRLCAADSWLDGHPTGSWITPAALAKEEGISINQFINSAVSEKLAALMTEGYLEERARRGSRSQFDKAMAKVADIEPEDVDQLPGCESG